MSTLCIECNELIEELFTDGYSCALCGISKHVECLQPSTAILLEGDSLFSYECSTCTDERTDQLHRQRLSWLQVVHLALYNLALQRSGRQGFFRWQEDICAFIKQKWTYLMPGRSCSGVWANSVMSCLSTHCPVVFQSGTKRFCESGWWALTAVQPPANPENGECNSIKYRYRHKKKRTAAQSSELIDAPIDEAVYGRGKRQHKERRIANAYESDDDDEQTTPKKYSNQKCVIVQSENSLKIPTKIQSNMVTSCQSSKLRMTIKKEPGTELENDALESKPLGDRANSNLLKIADRAAYFSSVNQPSIKQEKIEYDDIFLQSPELLDDDSGSGVGVDDLLDRDVPIDPFEVTFNEILNKPHTEVDVKSLGNELCIDTSFVQFETSANYSQVSSPVQMKTLTSIPSIPSSKFEVESTPIEPLSTTEEAELLLQLLACPRTVDEDPALRRLRRKLALRKLKRERGLPVFNLHATARDMIKVSAPDCLKHLFVNNEKSADSSLNTTVLNIPSYHHPALRGSNILDRFHISSRNSSSKRTPIDRCEQHSFVSRLMGGVEDLRSITSPYTSRILKPYIWRDFDCEPPKLKVMRELYCRFSTSDNTQRYPLDYVYVQPSHVSAMNDMCREFFWPDIDVAECLQYPEFSCIARYRKLLIGFALLVPDVRMGESYLSFLLVHPDWRGAGVGTFMLYHLTQACRGRDITLHVAASNSAMLLYQKFGFKCERMVPDFYAKYLPTGSKECPHAFLLRLQR